MKIIDNYRLVLGSKSPRRKELLGWLQIPFVVEVSTIEEISAKIKPQMIAEDIAQKARELLENGEERERLSATGVELASKFERKIMVKNYADKLFKILED